MVEEPKYNWGFEAALDVVGGKWKPLILYELKDGTLRFS
jgi:DNA-binding HxlR family transcriptional regulator